LEIFVIGDKLKLKSSGLRFEVKTIIETAISETRYVFKEICSVSSSTVNQG
jgi:hypothetical protein